MTTKSDRISAKPLLASSSVYSISDLNMLPFNRRRASASAPLKSFLFAAATLLVVLLTVIVVYLMVSLCHVQRHLTIVNRELTSVSNRLDRVEKKLLSTQKENYTLPEVSRSESTTGNHSLMLLQQLPYEQRDNRKRHRVGKREAESKSQSSTTTSAVQRRKRSRNSIDRQMRLVYKNVKDIRLEMDSLRNEVAHPSALMVRPNDTSNDDYTSTDDNAIPWAVQHNNLFATQDSTHLVVKTAGTYFIYLQITYKGQRKSVNPTCSHMVMLQNPNYSTRYRPLLYGSRTQIQLGKVIRYLQKGPDIRAIDTVHQSGIFHLTVGDRIYVKPDDVSHECIVSKLKEHSFFGAFRLQSSVNEYV